MNGIIYFIFGVILIILQIYFYKSVFLVVKNKINTKIYAVILAIITVFTIIFYLWYLKTNNAIYTWDNSVYYKEALMFNEKFQTNFIKACKSVVGSIWYNDYNCFTFVLFSGVFQFTNLTIDSYILCICLFGVIPSIFLFSVLYTKILSMLNIKSNYSIFVATIFALMFPIYHIAAVNGIPAIFGMALIGCMILIVLDYDFSKLEPKRLLLLFISTICLLITKRWFAYFIVAFYTCYILIIIAKGLEEKNFRMLKFKIKNMFTYFVTSALAGVAILFPFFKRVLTYNYGDRYSPWKKGGFTFELISQVKYIGLLYLILILIGISFGIYNKKTRWFSVGALLVWMLSIIMFTRVQNMGVHQTLILVPSYIIAMFLCICCFVSLQNKVARYFLIAFFLFIIVFNFVYCINNANLLGTFASVNLKPIIREDILEIKAVSEYLDKNCTKEKKAFIIAGNSMYNVETFTNVFLPLNPLKDKVYPEYSVDKTHGFPIPFFTAKYVLIFSPPQKVTYSDGEQKVVSVLQRAIISEKTVKNHFKLVKKFRIDSGLYIDVYERVFLADKAEIDYFNSKFVDYFKDYPDLYSDRINEYLKNTELISVNKNKTTFRSAILLEK